MRRAVLPVLGYYLDFILVQAFVSLASVGLADLGERLLGVRPPWFADIGLSIVLVLIGRGLGVAPSQWLLAPVTAVWTDPERPRLWANLVLGTFLLLDGLKQMTRWAHLEEGLVVFGLMETTPVKVAVVLAMGALYAVAGAMLIRIAPRGRLVALGATVVGLLSLAISWPMLPESVARAQVARRALQGRPVAPGSIEALQTMMPWMVVGMFVVMLVLLWLCSERSATQKALSLRSITVGRSSRSTTGAVRRFSRRPAAGRSSGRHRLAAPAPPGRPAGTRGAPPRAPPPSCLSCASGPPAPSA